MISLTRNSGNRILIPQFLILLAGVSVFSLALHIAVADNGLIICGVDVGIWVERAMVYFIAFSCIAIMSHALISHSFLGPSFFGHLLLLNWKWAVAGFLLGHIILFTVSTLDSSK